MNVLPQQHNSYLVDDTHDHDRGSQNKDMVDEQEEHMNKDHQSQRHQQQQNEEEEEEEEEEKDNQDFLEEGESSSPCHFPPFRQLSPSPLNDETNDNETDNEEENNNDTNSILGTTKDFNIPTSLKRTRASIIDSIEWLGRHVPCCVLSQISREVLDYKRGNPLKHNFSMPYALPYEAALLFVDISGFTKLSQSLDVESLSKTINSYFQAIVDEVTAHGGDILKFAGDAIFAEWRVCNHKPNDNGQPPCSNVQCPSECNQSQDECSHPQLGQHSMTIEDCVHAAAECGAIIVQKCSDFPVYSKSISGGKGPLVSTLNVHCGLGAGKMVGIHVGNNMNRREYLFLGEPIDQVAEACNAAKSGELKASREVLCFLDVKKEKFREDKSSKSVVIASRQSTFFRNQRDRSEMADRMQKSMFSLHSQFNIPFDLMDLVDLECFHRLLSFYIHPVVLSDEKAHLGKYNSTRDDQNARERHRAEAELRSVFTMFLMPKIKINLTDSLQQNKNIYDQLHFIMNTVTSILDTYKGHLRQYIVDDKGVVLIATFGLRGSTFPNLVSERALPSCRRIYDALRESLGIECQIGATLGKVYCGVVGGLHRHEYAVLGPSVNLSARLMSLKNHPGILVDEAVRQKVKCMNFIPYPPVKAKGYIDLVPVFQPLSSKESRWGRADPKFVGRNKEIDTICNISKTVTGENNQPQMVFVWGESGSGKSAFIVQAIAKVRTMLLSMRKRVVITRNISSEGDMLVPFSLFRSIFRDVLHHRPKSEHNAPESKGDASSRGRD